MPLFLYLCTHWVEKLSPRQYGNSWFTLGLKIIVITYLDMSQAPPTQGRFLPRQAMVNAHGWSNVMILVVLLCAPGYFVRFLNQLAVAQANKLFLEPALHSWTDPEVVLGQ